MSCSVAVSNSPVFSPSSSLFRNKTSAAAAAAEVLTLKLTQMKASASHNSPLSSPSSPRSPFRLRLQKPPVSSSSSSSSSGPVLKRKRPARLVIPAFNTGFDADSGAVTPAADVAEVEREGFGYSVYCKKGRREAMEDRFSAVVDLEADPKQAFFGIFDGHGGCKAAEYAAKNLDTNIVEEITSRDEEQIEDAVKHGYLNTDTQFLKEDLRGGSCCVSALIRNGNLVVSNVGDCRAVMSIGGVSQALTSDHRPCREDEKKRIEALGGYVDLIHGVWRIQGSLAVSRGFGDRHLKEWVIAEPETKILKLKPECEFLILASDGLWDKVGNQEAVDIARAWCVGVEKPEPLSACKKLVDLSVARGSIDDISVMLIQMEPFVC